MSAKPIILTDAELAKAGRDLAAEARKCIPIDYYIHEKVDATFAEVAATATLMADRIELLSHRLEKIRWLTE